MFTPRPVDLPRTYATPPRLQPADLWLDGRAGLRWPDDQPSTGADAHRYPDPTALTALLAGRWNLSSDQVIVTAGADEAIDRACRAFLAPGRRAVLTDPTFTMLPRYTQLAGAETFTVPWPDGELPADRLVETMGTESGLLAVVSPNNPTGAVATADQLLDLAHRCPRALLLVDLAYVEFADQDPTDLLLERANILVVRTFSKAWGLASARVGYAMGRSEVIDALRAAGGPFPTAASSLARAEYRWRNSAEALPRRMAQIGRERFRLRRLLRATGLEVPESQANFLLARGPRSSWLADGLVGLGIGVRRLDDDAVRISLPGDATVFRRLWSACRTVLSPQALLLDMDGVLADVSRSYREAIRLTARALGVVVSADDIAAAKSLAGSNNDWLVTRRLVQAAGSDVSQATVTRRFEDIMTAQQLWRRERLIPDPDRLRRLAGRLPLAVVTGRPLADAQRFLSDHGLTDLTSVLVTMDDAPAKPDPAPVQLALNRLGVRRAWMLGDTPDDILSARAAGVLPLGITAPGDPAGTVHRLLTTGAARVLEGFTDIEEMLP